ncbi:hypothetical protein [Acidovorax sp. NCPPB 3576]|uniref:hypothetical protein n=1 Tax=Acidovorax sp. NCPPB 3576 TaxID=2940488 RepID=UPI0023490492|nr:hypothetical protein [Acidovorax sp. NCPPB 3576]WCM88835.1 hypothetical protein M5C98_01920 [Acidovorax sp. NCPPB 3576]
MKKCKQAIAALVIHTFVCTMLYLWKVLGVAGAGNMLMAWCALNLAGGIGLVLTHKDTEPPTPAALPFGIARILYLSEMAVLLWFGHWVMFLCLGFTWLMSAGSNKRRRDHWAAQAAKV